MNPVNVEPYQKALISKMLGVKNTEEHFFIPYDIEVGGVLSDSLCRDFRPKTGFYAVKSGEFVRLRNNTAHTVLPYVADGFEIQEWIELTAKGEFWELSVSKRLS
jgi:hypothetical protein